MHKCSIGIREGANIGLFIPGRILSPNGDIMYAGETYRRSGVGCIETEAPHA
jgi:hypothetical protein